MTAPPAARTPILRRGKEKLKAVLKLAPRVYTAAATMYDTSRHNVDRPTGAKETKMGKKQAEWVTNEKHGFEYKVLPNGDLEFASPPCARCENEPRWPIQTRATGEWYLYSLGRECETARKKAQRAKKKAEAKAARDDLTAIKGIGSATQDKLYEAGVTTYADLAAADANGDVKAEWIEAAAELAKEGE